MSDVVFSIAKQFSKHPGPRFARQGPYSGEALRRRLDELLKKDFETVIIDLDGTTGYGSSFLDEAFGGLVRSDSWKREVILSRMQFRSVLDPSYIDEIMDSIAKAEPANSKPS